MLSVRAWGTGALAAALAATLALAACGGNDAESPLDDALGYLPEASPLAVAVSTDLESRAYEDLDVALQRFGVEGGLEAGFEGFSEGAVDFERDIQPLLGNELVIGLLPGGGGEAEAESYFPPFVAAIEVSDGDRVRDQLESIGLEETDEVEGAGVYGPTTSDDAAPGEEPSAEEDGTAVAIDGDLVIYSESRLGLEDALKQRGEDDRLTESEFDDRMGDLPADGLIRASGDVPSLIESIGIEQVAGVPWIESLKSFGLVATVDGRTATADAELSGDEVSEDELPLAPGAESPEVAQGEASFATLDQAQSLAFALDVAKAAAPQAALDAVVNRIESAVNGSVSGLAEQFGAGVAAEIDPGKGKQSVSVTRSEVADPATVSSALESLNGEVLRLVQISESGGPATEALEAARLVLPALPIPEQSGFTGSGSKVEPVAGEPGLYRIAGSGPTPQLPPGIEPPPDIELPSNEFVFGLIDNVWVTAPSVEAAKQAAALPTIPHDGPPGSVVANLPLRPSDLGLPAPHGADVVVTTVKLGIETSTTGLSLELEAGL